jgi:hypothetical protein
MAKRAVRELISSWSGYSNYEIEKFNKMGKVDEDYVSMMSSHLNTSLTSSENKMLDATAVMSLMQSRSSDSISDYVEFQDIAQKEANMLRDIIPQLNKTATASLAQLSESATQFDVEDNKLDVSARNSMIDAIIKFESSLDKHAEMALAAANGQLVVPTAL